MLVDVTKLRVYLNGICTLLKYDSVRQTQLIYLLIIIRLATCFDPTGSSSGLYYEPVDTRKLRTFFGSQTLFGIPRMFAAL
jgi:hypothetical protein